ncbi:MAG: DUF2892 domain-containing protein [Spirochaetaceae bacterium]|nr:DUF2892 domain-containing protein [Spirochaetaceae bacterium]MCF7948220.1 DUF2892 domain-containing protein [Spirochaetia bacterium]MCF7952400.1 DUF2892 domain-containing protein [Spirochaetaceae bacterium]
MKAIKENMGKTDKVLRILAVVAIVALNITVNIHPILALLLGIAAVVLVFTAVAGVCPLYRMIGISTKKDQPK